MNPKPKGCTKKPTGGWLLNMITTWSGVNVNSPQNLGIGLDSMTSRILPLLASSRVGVKVGVKTLEIADKEKGITLN